MEDVARNGGPGTEVGVTSGRNVAAIRGRLPPFRSFDYPYRLRLQGSLRMTRWGGLPHCTLRSE